MGLFLTRDVPEVDSLQFTLPSLTTRVFSRNGEVLQEYGVEKRVLIPYSEISPHFVDALVATEDASFFTHHGISFRGIARAVWVDIRDRRFGQGGSTITQQLAREYFLTKERTITRKLKEMILAINIERNYSKEQILEKYANKVPFGHGHYGVESASRYFFSKPAKDLTPTEAALIAGLIRAPSTYSPRAHPDRALKRRNWVLGRLFRTEKITQQQYDQFIKEPIQLAPPPLKEQGVAAYVSERIRMYLEQKYGEEALYEQGLRIYTTIDPVLQEIAQQAVRDGLHEYDHRKPYRGSLRGENIPNESSKWPPTTGDRLWATVKAVEREKVTVTLAEHDLTLVPEQWKWVRVLDPKITFREGDRVLLFIKAGGPEPTVELDQMPEVQGALVAINPATGEVLSLVGGYNFADSMFNRAIQAKRQTGSAVKPLIYSTAWSQGVTLADTVVDEPTLFLTGRELAENLCSKEGYIPRDFDPGYLGMIPFRRAVEKSVNIAAVKLLNQIGYSGVIETARRLHISTELHPYPSMALGAFEITLWELTGAFGAIANRGVWIEPHFIDRITDHEGRILEEFRPKTSAAIDPAVTYIMIQAMKGVVQRGTAMSARKLPGHFGGKTGTTNDYTDSWFVGFNPAVVCGVWAGRDDHLTLGNKETGARVALPIWKRFMEPATLGQEDLDFPMPDGIVKVLIDPKTGLRAGMDSPCTEIVEEVFIEGTEPTHFCDGAAHFRLRLPYFLQAYPVERDLSIVIPEDDLEILLRTRSDSLFWTGVGRQMSVTWGGTTFPLKVRVAPARDPSAPQAVMPDLPPEGTFKCGARVEYINEKR